MNDQQNGAVGGVMEGNMIQEKQHISRALHHVGTADSLPERVVVYLFSQNGGHWHTMPI